MLHICLPESSVQMAEILGDAAASVDTRYVDRRCGSVEGMQEEQPPCLAPHGEAAREDPKSRG